MKNHKKKAQLLDYLDRHLFQPIFETSIERHNEAELGRLEDVQTLMRAERERFHSEDESADDVRDHFVHNADVELYRTELRTLGLPTFTELRGDFLSFCRQLHIPLTSARASSSKRRPSSG
jgi:hypothetical protein